ncbi:hypothetical protein MXZ81_05920 [Streptococcus uberis]|nr:hypothetical protein [Streptococcus uberis]
MKYSVVGDDLGYGIGLFDNLEEALLYAESIIRKELPEEDIKIDDEFSLFGYGYEIMKIEELGVLVNDKTQFFMKFKLYEINHLIVDEFAIFTEKISEAFKCTRKEAEQFPQFKWVALSELEGINESKN